MRRKWRRCSGRHQLLQPFGLKWVANLGDFRLAWHILVAVRFKHVVLPREYVCTNVSEAFVGWLSTKMRCMAVVKDHMWQESITYQVEKKFMAGIDSLAQGAHVGREV